MNIEQIENKISKLSEKGSVSVDDRIDLSEELTLLGDKIADLFQKLSEIPELDDAPDGEADPRDQFIDGLMRTIEVSDD